MCFWSSWNDSMKDSMEEQKKGTFFEEGESHGREE
jgi:hypothetical protein